MNEKKMYVITMATGSYDDYGVAVVAVTDDFEKGSAYVNKMNTTYASAKEKMDSFHKNEYPKWMRENPRPGVKDYKPTPIPKWTGNQRITQEMRDERKKLEEENRKLAQAAMEPMTKWAAELKDFTEQWVKANLTEEEQEMQKNMNDNYWEIEETPWLK